MCVLLQWVSLLLGEGPLTLIRYPLMNTCHKNVLR